LLSCLAKAQPAIAATGPAWVKRIFANYFSDAVIAALARDLDLDQI
jgi:hypothetical protein